MEKKKLNRYIKDESDEVDVQEIYVCLWSESKVNENLSYSIVTKAFAIFNDGLMFHFRKKLYWFKTFCMSIEKGRDF